MTELTVYVVDDERGMLEVCEESLEQLGALKIRCFSDPRLALASAAEERVDILISDLRMPGMGGKELVDKIRMLHTGLGVLVMTAFPTVETAVGFMKKGAFDYLSKPVDPSRLMISVEALREKLLLLRRNESLARQLERPYLFGEIVGDSEAMKEVMSLVSKAAMGDAEVLIQGESGCGKELVARALHRHGLRSEGPFVPVDCGAIPESLFEAEFFGSEKGAFTGADRMRIGLLELAHNGTLFLDEVGEMPLTLQVKILRVLQERCFRRVGGRSEISVNLRVVAATNRDLKQEVKAGRFREDLFYRLHVIPVILPPLRRRGTDVLLLARHFLALMGQRDGKIGLRLDGECEEILLAHSWPGNVRELQNLLKRCSALSEGSEIGSGDLPQELVEASGSDASFLGGFFSGKRQAIREFECGYFEDLLSRHQGDVRKSCEDSGLPRGTLYRLLKKNSLDVSDYRRS